MLASRMAACLVVGATLACAAGRPVSAPPPRGAPSRPAGAAPCRPLSTRSARALQAALDAAVGESHGYGGGVLRVESLDCGPLWEGASGRATHDEPRAMQADDAFEVASITKAMTATLVMQLVEAGALSLDAPLASVAPDLVDGLLVIDGRDASGAITARQLLGHTSGLPDYWTDPPFVADGENAFLRAFLADPDRLWAPKELLTYARSLRPAGRPGGAYHYADTGYVLLGMVLERLTGKPLHALLRERIFRPLAMGDSYLSYREPAPAAPPLASRYEDHLDVRGQRRQSADWASGGVVSTARDLSRFAAGLAKGTCFASPATLSAMQGWHATGTTDVDYGLGLFRVRLDGGGELWGHDGHGNAFLYVWPQRRILFTGTLNQTSNDWWPLLSGAMQILARDAKG